METKLYTAEYRGSAGHYWLKRKTMSYIRRAIAFYFWMTDISEWKIEEVTE